MSSPHHHSKIPVPPLRTPSISQRSAATSMERDIKSFSHELDYCVQPLPFWKSLPIEEVMVIIRAEFDKVKGETDGELRVFAGGMASVIKKTSESGSKDRLMMLRHTAVAVALIPADDLYTPLVYPVSLHSACSFAEGGCGWNKSPKAVIICDSSSPLDQVKIYGSSKDI